jgi:ubiquinone/menaquinone biosynthesis C-methylase UbiE
MNSTDASNSPTGEVEDYYKTRDEDGRLTRDIGPLEMARSQELIKRYFPPIPAVVCDVGGATGAYSFWLAGLGYDVHLVDLVPSHVEKAVEKSKIPGSPRLASMKVGDARNLDYPDELFDAILMHGPLYHLVERKDRVAALAEARRILRSGGTLLAFAITRYASTIVGLLDGRIWNSDFVDMIREEIATGQHKRCPSNSEASFRTAFFHHPDELKAELDDAGLISEAILGVLGPAWMARDFEQSWQDEVRREVLLNLARMLENEPVLGPRLLAVSRKASK